MPSSSVGQPERHTQQCVIALFRDELGYRYLGDWTEREGNSNIEEGLLADWLRKRDYTPYNPVTDFTPIVDIGRYLYILVVDPALPVKSVTELFAYARAPSS